MRDRSFPLAGFLVLALVAAATLTAFWKVTSAGPFFYDEADYMYAGTRGFVANYLDRPSLSLLEFARKGMELARDKSRRSDMSQLIRSSGDITFYRHYHGPVYAYWIALWHAFGVRGEGVYRASGLVVHLFSTALIFFMFRVAFPGSPTVAAFVAAFSFLLNRTALMSSTSVTQHVAYTFTAAVTLFLASMFFRTRERRWWYGACAALGVSFATVESSFILVAVFVVLLLVLGPQLGWRPVAGLLGRGTLCFLLAAFIVWPKGILELGALKGYAYLGYMAIMRKTLMPMSPMELWRQKIVQNPEEFLIPLAALVLSAVFWKRLPDRQALVPFIAYGFLFLAVTMVITAPFPYYHASLLMATAVVTGAVFGWLWTGANSPTRVILALAVALPLGWMPIRYYSELAARRVHDPRVELLSWLSTHGAASVIVPYALVPTLHFYDPGTGAIGYDVGASPALLADLLRQPGRVLLCEEALCRSVRGLLPGNTGTEGSRVMGADPDVFIASPLFPLQAAPAHP